MSAQLSLFKSRRQRGVAPPPAKEFATTCMVADVLKRWGTPNWMWSHLPMGEKREPVTAARLQRMGVRRGFPDFLLLGPKNARTAGAHFLELKRHGAKPTEEQAGFALWCSLNGVPHAFADNFKDAVEVLKQWGAVRAGIDVQ